VANEISSSITSRVRSTVKAILITTVEEGSIVTGAAVVLVGATVGATVFSVSLGLFVVFGLIVGVGVGLIFFLASFGLFNDFCFLVGLGVGSGVTKAFGVFVPFSEDFFSSLGLLDAFCFLVGSADGSGVTVAVGVFIAFSGLLVGSGAFLSLLCDLSLFCDLSCLLMDCKLPSTFSACRASC